MGKLLFTNTELAEYEYMMQQIFTSSDICRLEKKRRNQYISFLRQYMKEYGYSSLIKRISTVVKNMVFDDCLFISEAHKNLFHRMYYRQKKQERNSDYKKTAVIYLLSTDESFKTILENYIYNPLYVLPVKLPVLKDDDGYSMYHAAKKILGMRSGLLEEDLLEDDILTDKALCLILNAKMIAKYGLRGYLNNPSKKERQRYVNTPYKSHRR